MMTPTTVEITPAIAPTCSDTASASITIASTSRPYWSVPSQCSGDGTSHFWSAAIASGFWPPPIRLTRALLNTATSARISSATRPAASFQLPRTVRQIARRALISASPPVLHARIEDGQQQVQHQVGGQHAEDGEVGDAEDRVEVEDPDRLHQRAAEARIVEQLLDQHVAVEDEAELDAER